MYHETAVYMYLNTDQFIFQTLFSACPEFHRSKKGGHIHLTVTSGLRHVMVGILEQYCPLPFWLVCFPQR